MKKLLALVLALVMTMSLVTISNAAFKDADKISNKEAVDVMAAVGVLAGYDNGEFGATDTLTRAQAAKIIAYLDLGGKTADAIKGTGTVFSDVKATDWFAGFVEYCAGAGYVAGVGDKKFAPNEKVTGVQFAKMLLCALGYSAEIEGYTGADYTIAIARDANKNELFNALSIVTSANLTREQAAQMALNALKATVVEYRGGTSVSTSDGTKVTVGATRIESAANGKEYLAGDTSANLQLAEKLYGSDLKLDKRDATAFGDTANTWSYKGKEIGTYAVTADATLSNEVTYGDLYTAIGSTAVKQLRTLTVKVDGKPETVTAANIVKGSDGALKNTSNVALTGNGTKTAVYVTYISASQNYDVTVVVVNTYAGQISGVTKATASADRYVSITNKGDAITLANSGKYETESFAKNDIVLYTAAWNSTNSNYEVKTAVAATKVAAAEVTAIKAAKNFTAAGTTYKYAKTFLDANYLDNTDLGDAYDIYVDANGYVVYLDLYNGAVSFDNYLVITKYGTAGLDADPIANVVKMDGTMASSVKLGKVDGKTVTGSAASKADGKVVENTLYSFTVASDGKYNLKSVAAPYADAAITPDVVKTVSGVNYNLYNGTTNVGDGYSANAATTFVVYNTTEKEVKVYTGIDAMVNVKTAANIVVLTKTGSTTAKLVFVAAADANIASNTASAKDFVYILGAPVQTKSGDDVIYTYDAIVNGEVTTIASKDLDASTLTAKTLFVVKSYDGSYIKTADPYNTASVTDYTFVGTGALADGTKVEYSDSVLKIASSAYVVASDCSVFVIDKDANVTNGTVDGVAQDNAKNDKYFLVIKTNNNVDKVVSIYLQEG